MKGLAVEIKKVPFQKRASNFVDALLIILLILIAFALLPLLIILWIGGLLINLLTPKKHFPTQNEWNEIRTNDALTLKYKWADVDDLPDYICKYFDPQPLILIDSIPNNDFFNGYFTDLMVKRSDGIFVQKVNCNNDSREIISLPLCFFNFSSMEIEQIKDLKGFELDTKGNPDDFMVTGFGEDYELQIRLKKE